VKLRVGFGVFAAVAAFAAQGGAAAKPPVDFHDARYCEFLVLTGDVPNAKVTVYNTIGLNKCPASKWDPIDAGELAQELGAKLVIKNGPRHFLMDSATGDPGQVKSFDGLKMRKVATIAIHSQEELAQRTYSERTITRDNTWTWDEGTRVYELLAPDGSDYVMQSYSQIVDPDLSIDQLRGLGDRLKLPQGWEYRSRVLKEDLKLKANGSATIVQDDLTDTYQLVSRKQDAKRHDVHVDGQTKNVGSPGQNQLEDRGTVSGQPFGDGTIDIIVTLGDNQSAKGTFTIDANDGQAFGTVDMTYAITGNEIDFTGTVDFTGGTGDFRGIKGSDLAAHDHNTLDGQNGAFELDGSAKY
jgi:hypothetical protein